MHGVYVHIPFCKSRCKYCDFFSTTLLSKREEYVEALLMEYEQRDAVFQDSPDTLYLGGGTPSMLDSRDVAKLVAHIASDSTKEITMEANPGDLNQNYLEAIRKAGVNRLSIGIQSFNDRLLTLIGRRHSAQQAITAVRMAQDAGFDHISVDLIYGLPTQTIDEWKQDIEQVLQLNVQHISTYCLSYEDNTPLTKMLEDGQIEAIDDETENDMYDLLCAMLKQRHWEHYEVSNFSLKDCQSKHNSSYWNETPYLGLGAGAHSYDGRMRWNNPCDIDAYIKGTCVHALVREEEILTDEQRHIERVMLGLRTKNGIALDSLGKMAQAKALQYVAQGMLRQEGKQIVATQEGLHLLNRIIEDLI